MKKYKLYIFDLDGVILNSKSNMEHHGMIKYDLKPKFEDYFSLIGAPFLKILKS